MTLDPMHSNAGHHDFVSICDLKYNYAMGVDTRDSVLLRTVLADRVAFDFSSYNDRPAATVEADSWIKGLQPLLTGLAVTQHSMTNPIIAVEGETARIRMYMQAEHILDHDDPTAWFTIGGYYIDEAVRRDGEWRLCAVALTVLWRRGRPEIMSEAAARGARVLEG